MSSKLSDLQIQHLIQEIEKKKEIWDKTNAKHNPKDLNIAWEDLDKITRLNKNIIMNKWRTLKRQMRSAMESYNDDEAIIRKFQFYKDMHFVQDQIKAEIEADERLMQRNPPQPQQILDNSLIPDMAANDNNDQESPIGIEDMSNEDFLKSLLPCMQKMDANDKVEVITELMKLSRWYLYKK